jgi:hypothetical protein
MLTATSVTIASGAITVTTRPEGIAHYTVNGEGAADDILSTINGGTDGEWLMIRKGDAEIIVDEAGNIEFPADQKGYILSDPRHWMLMWYDLAATKWRPFMADFTHLITDRTDTYKVIATNLGQIAIIGTLNLDTTVFQLSGDKLTGIDKGFITIAPETGSADNFVSLETLGTSTLGTIIFATLEDDTDTITLKNNNAGGTTGFKFFTSGGTNITLTDNRQILVFIYNTTLDSGNGGWVVGLLAASSIKTITTTHSAAANAATTPLAFIGPMPQGGVMISHAAKKLGTTAVGATAWIGDIHKVLAADLNTNGIGTTIFGTKPTITSTNFYSAAATLSVTTFAAGDGFYFFTDQAPTGTGNFIQTLNVVYDT